MLPLVHMSRAVIPAYLVLVPLLTPVVSVGLARDSLTHARAVMQRSAPPIHSVSSISSKERFRGSGRILSTLSRINSVWDPTDEWTAMRAGQFQGRPSPPMRACDTGRRTLREYFDTALDSLPCRRHVERTLHPPAGVSRSPREEWAGRSRDTKAGACAGDMAGVTPCLAPGATAALPSRTSPFASSRSRQTASRTWPSPGVSRGLRGLEAGPETVSGVAGVLASRGAAFGVRAVPVWCGRGGPSRRTACRRLRGRGICPVASRAAATARLPARRSGRRRRRRRSRGRCTGQPLFPIASLRSAGFPTRRGRCGRSARARRPRGGRPPASPPASGGGSAGCGALRPARRPGRAASRGRSSRFPRAGPRRSPPGRCPSSPAPSPGR